MRELFNRLVDTHRATADAAADAAEALREDHGNGPGGLALAGPQARAMFDQLHRQAAQLRELPAAEAAAAARCVLQQAPALRQGFARMPVEARVWLERG